MPMEENVEQARVPRKPRCTCGECQKCKRRAYDRKYYERHGAAVRGRSAAYRATHQEAEREKARMYSKSVRGRELARAWDATNPTYARSRRLQVRYDLSLEEYAARLEAQGGVCARCKEPETCLDGRTGKLRALAVDHCHTTGKIRALLCHHCNIRIGGRESRLLQLEGDLRYLMEHASPAVELLRQYFTRPRFEMNPFV
jgi:Recombination endonuclease VII